MKRPAGRLVAAVLALALLCAPALTLTGCRNQPQYFTASWFDVFDTVTMVQGYAASQAEWDRQTEALHQDLLRYHRLFDIYNSYEDGTPNLCDVNRTAGQTPTAVSGELFDFLTFARSMYDRTDGACNIAAGAVLRLWHNAREMDTPVPPADADLQAAAAHISIDSLVLDETERTVFFADPAMTLDVGAIGKGYATEMAARAAKERGLTCALLNVGGNVRAIGAKPDGSRWTAGVENPRGAEPAYLAAVDLSDGDSLVISGDYLRYFEYEGVRYHHLIDLTTLQPARYAVSTAIRTAQGSGVADALSTGVFCLPRDRGRALVEAEPHTEAMWVSGDGSVSATAGFDADLLP